MTTQGTAKVGVPSRGTKNFLINYSKTMDYHNTKFTTVSYVLKNQYVILWKLSVGGGCQGISNGLACDWVCFITSWHGSDEIEIDTVIKDFAEKNLAIKYLCEFYI